MATFDLTAVKADTKYRLRNGETWRFLYLGSLSKNIAVGAVGGFNMRQLCLFTTTGRYRMDDVEHELDIVEQIAEQERVA